MSREQQSREADDLMPGQSGAKIPAINLPRASCIYQIRCIPTGKIYVGRAVNLRLRWELHKSRLRRGIHHNKHLQNAWDRYGEVNFEISVLEIVDRSKLLSTEQAWIDKTGCVSREFGFNIYPTAGSPGDTLTQVWEGFIDPNGQPIGPITNLAAFCRERGLEKSHVVGVARGRLCSHQGWTYTSGKQRMQKFHAGFVNPDGQPVIMTNLTAKCREHGLHPVHMHQLKNGQRRSHKGWTWRTQDE